MQYELSIEADKDLENIFDYTLQEFGSNQAMEYVSSFENTSEKVCWNPEIGRRRVEIRLYLGSIVKESHVVFYRLLDNRIRIVRIFHGSMDLPQRFRDD